VNIARYVLAVAAVAAALALALLPQKLVQTSGPDETPAVALSPEEAELGPTIRSYLLKNPQLLREMMASLQSQDAAAAAEKRKAAFAEHKQAIYNSDKEVVLGNPNGDVTLVEFFDYNCGYCRHALPDLLGLLDSDPKLRVVLKEFPVLGPGSQEAARVAVAVRRQAPEKYLAFHRAMLGSDQAADGARALEVAKGLGLDMARLSADLADPIVDETIDESMSLAQSLGIDGTPTYIVADSLVPGAVGRAALATMIKNARSCGKIACS